MVCCLLDDRWVQGSPWLGSLGTLGQPFSVAGKQRTLKWRRCQRTRLASQMKFNHLCLVLCAGMAPYLSASNRMVAGSAPC